jgi:SagB-type dehydrogenase family enzyme
MMLDQKRRKVLAWLIGRFALMGLAICRPFGWAAANSSRSNRGVTMKLPPPRCTGDMSVEQAIRQRRTVRSFGPQSLSLDQLSQLLWAAQGITGSKGFKRAAPSAGALYPMDVYAAIGNDCVERLTAGVYHYRSDGHQIKQIMDQDLRDFLARAALSQMWMAGAPLQLVITAEYSRITVKYGWRGNRYAMIEAGHIGQNIFLQAEALGLKAGIVGAFNDKKLAAGMGIPGSHEPLLIMPVGYTI